MILLHLYTAHSNGPISFEYVVFDPLGMAYLIVRLFFHVPGWPRVVVQFEPMVRLSVEEGRLVFSVDLVSQGFQDFKFQIAHYLYK